LEAIRSEIAAQLERALAAGIDVTHLDCHMAVLFHADVQPLYVELAARHRLTLFNARWDERTLGMLGLESAAVEPSPALPAFVRSWMSPLDRPDEDAAERVCRQIAKLPVGLSQMIFHPARDGVELRAIAPDHRARVADFELLRSGKLAVWLSEEGVEVVSYRQLRDLVLRSACLRSRFSRPRAAQEKALPPPLEQQSSNPVADRRS